MPGSHVEAETDWSKLYSIPGFLNNVNPKIKVDEGSKHFYSLTFVLGFLIGEPIPSIGSTSC